MSDKKSLTCHLCLVEGKSIKESAYGVGLSGRTNYNWLYQYSRKNFKNAANQAPAAICENLSNQLVELQKIIAAPEPDDSWLVQPLVVPSQNTATESNCKAYRGEFSKPKTNPLIMNILSKKSLQKPRFFEIY